MSADLYTPTHINAHLHAPTHINAHLHTPTHINANPHTPTHINAHLHTPIHINAHLHTPTHINAHLLTPTHINAHLHTPTHINAHLHTHVTLVPYHVFTYNITFLLDTFKRMSFVVWVRRRCAAHRTPHSVRLAPVLSTKYYSFYNWQSLIDGYHVIAALSSTINRPEILLLYISDAVSPPYRLYTITSIHPCSPFSLKWVVYLYMLRNELLLS